MIKHFIITAFRNILHQKLFSAINTFGLSISMAAAFLILLYVVHELSYDSEHTNKNDIYRLVRTVQRNKETLNEPETSRALASKIKQQIPEIKETARTLNYSTMYYDGIYIEDEKGKVFINNCLMVDNSFFEVFTINILSGNENMLFNNLNSILVSEKMAKKYFGHTKIVGESIEFTHQGGHSIFTIAGVFKNLDHSTCVQADFIGNIDYIENDLDSKDAYPWAHTFILVKQNSDIQALSKKINTVIDHDYPENKKEYFLQALNDVYFHSEHVVDYYGRTQKGDIKNIYIFAAIALAILLIATINYILMSTANSISRATEIGIRKTLGASRTQMFGQILTESLMISSVAFLTAIVLAEIFLPLANEIFAKELEINYSRNWVFVMGMVLITLFVTIISGTYTSIYLSRYEAIKVLKKQLIHFNNKASFRKVLIVFQLVIFVVLILCTTTINKQIHFAQNKDLGFKRENLINVLCIVGGESFQQKNEILLNEIKTCPYVSSAAATYGGLSLYDLPKVNASTIENPQNAITIGRMSIGDDFLKTMGINLLYGRNLNKNTGPNSILLNQTAVKKLGIKNPLDETLIINKKSYRIIGVVQDFNIKSLRSEIPPLIIDNEKTIANILVRVSDEEHTQKAISFIEQKWDNIFSNYAGRFHHYLVDQRFRNGYSTEQNFGRTIQTFAILSILIAFLGLFGLTAFIAKQKTKEIGIRKVFGASVFTVIKKISNNLLLLTVIANVITWPICWLLINNWLQNFAYTIKTPYEIFLITGIASIVFVLAILTLNAYKTATANPVDSLRYE